MNGFEKLWAKRERPLTTEAEIRASLDMEADEVFEDAKGDGMEFLDENVTMTLERFEKAFIGESLWRLAPGVRSLHARCVAENWTAPERGVLLDNDARFFSVPVANPSVIMLGVERGESRYVTVVHTGKRKNGGDDQTVVMVGRWKPDAADFLTGLPDPLPADLHTAFRLASQAARYADIGSDSTLEAMARKLAERSDRMPYRTGVTEATFFEFKDARVPTMYSQSRQAEIGTWFDYTEIMAPVVEMAPPPEEELFHTSGTEREPAAALALDGGFFGPVSARLARGFRGRMLVNQLRTVSDAFRGIHETLSDRGYVWGKKSLVHGDADMRSFAVPLQDPTKRAFVHQSIFGRGPAARYLVLLSLDDAQTVSGVEVHPLYKPVASQHENWRENATVDDLMLLSGRVGELADPQASPPRLSQSEFIRRLQAAEPLPPAALSVDLANGVAAEPTRIGAALANYMMIDMIGATRKALHQLVSGGPEHSSLKDSREFGDEEAGEFAPGGPGPKR